MTLVPRSLCRLVVVPLTLLLAVCGDGDRSPSGPGSPSPSAAPTPAPTPTPVAQTNCQRIGFGPGPGTSCPRESATFQREVDEAIERLMRERGDIFNGNTVLSVGQYYLGVIDNLEKAGVCADFDGEELQVKINNDYNDQYHIMTSAFLVRKGAGSYRTTCYPAAFPTPAPPLPSTPGCSLPPSKDKACGVERPSFLVDVEAVIAQLVREHPEYFDLNNVQRGTVNWYRVVNPQAYFSGVIAGLGARGLCARYDGVELAVKRDNRVSDQYDIWAGEGYTRRGDGSYRSTCYPAAF